MYAVMLLLIKCDISFVNIWVSGIRGKNIRNLTNKIKLKVIPL